MKCLIHTDFSTLVFGFSCLVFKKEKTEMGRSKGTEGTHQYKKELKRLRESTLKRKVTSIMIVIETNELHREVQTEMSVYLEFNNTGCINRQQTYNRGKEIVSCNI